jgi:hypothetical protein
MFISGFGMQPPAVAGEGLERIDLVLSASGLDSFEREYGGARDYEIEGIPVKVLPLGGSPAAVWPSVTRRPRGSDDCSSGVRELA